MEHFINLLCGVGLFLYGVNLMGEHSQSAFGERLKNLLSVMTKNRLSGVLTGFAVTGVIQSSCATTVMTVSFVNAGLMTLSQAIGIVMGANIGTTVTSLIIAFNFSSLAPFTIVLGTAVILAAKKEKTKHIGSVVVGFGLLFLGMNTMTSSFSYLRDNEAFLSLIGMARGKLPCIAAGFIITAIMQSSSATVGILQALCMSGLIGIENAVYIIFGQNIGAVVPTVISALGANKNAKAVAGVHLLFNIIGTGAFLLIGEFLPLHKLLTGFGNASRQVSAMHIIFNVVSTVLLLPFGDMLEKAVRKILNVKAI